LERRTNLFRSFKLLASLTTQTLLEALQRFLVGSGQIPPRNDADGFSTPPTRKSIHLAQRGAIIDSRAADVHSAPEYFAGVSCRIPPGFGCVQIEQLAKDQIRVFGTLTAQRCVEIRSKFTWIRAAHLVRLRYGRAEKIAPAIVGE
jgi:hypothetical protein